MKYILILLILQQTRTKNSKKKLNLFHLFLLDFVVSLASTPHFFFIHILKTQTNNTSCQQIFYSFILLLAVNNSKLILAFYVCFSIYFIIILATFYNILSRYYIVYLRFFTYVSEWWKLAISIDPMIINWVINRQTVFISGSSGFSWAPVIIIYRSICACPCPRSFNNFIISANPVTYT